MKKIVSIFLAAILAFSFGLTSFASVTATEANAVRDDAKATFDNLVKTKFDVDGSNSITAADARATLLYSAGLTQKGINTSKMDTDGDKKVTAIDARVILRLSAGLESVLDYMTEEKLAYFNAILNTAKPNNYPLYYNGYDYTSNVSYTDPKGVISSLDDAFEDIEGMDDSVSFSEALAGGMGDEIYDSKNTLVGSRAYANNRMMKISDSDGTNEGLSSYLTIDDVSDVVYKTNQAYTFTRYGTKKNANDKTVIDRSKVIYTEKVTGLDSLTVHIKSDNVVTGPHTSKAYVVYDQADIESDVKKVADQFNQMSMEMTKLYQINFNITPSVGGVKYYNAEITVYFDPEDGKIISAYYSLFTDYTMGFYMDVDIFMISPYVNVDKEGQVNITNSTQTVKEYYFIGNNSNHADWKNG